MKHIKLFESFLNEAKETFEITSTKGMDKSEAKKAINDHYHDRLTYRGNEFFDKIYMDILTKFAEEKLEIGEMEDVDDGDGGFDKERIDGQESYLGYLPDQDVFIEGYDMWGGSKNTVFIKLDDKLNPQDVSNSREFHFSNPSLMMYSSNGTLNALHNKFENLIDIRLD